MKISKIFFLVSIIFLFMSSATIVIAGDFSWMKDFNIEAKTNLEEFKARISARFKVGAAEVETVIKDIRNPADAYMIFRYGEMASTSTEHVIDKYKTDKNKGWGVLAKTLGIKPGSKEFKALKNGHDLAGYQMDENKKASKSKSKSKTTKNAKGKKKN